MNYDFILSRCQKIHRLTALRVFSLSLLIMILWLWASGIMAVRDINSVLENTDKDTKITLDTTQPLSTMGLSALFFGKYTPVMINVADVKKSMLTYRVVGIMLAEHDEDSQVIIDTLSGGDVVYRVGDMLPWGTVIRRITADGIFVERDGELESMSLPKSELIFAPPANPL